MNRTIARLKPLLTAIPYRHVRFYSKQNVIFLTEKELQSFDSLDDSVKARSFDIPDDFDDVPSEPVVRFSPEAEFGRKRIGCVELPQPLVKGITDLINDHDKRLVRTDALRIYEALRSTARLPKEEDKPLNRWEKKKDKARKKVSPVTEPHTLSYGPRESVAYAAGAMASTYGAIYNVLAEVAKRIPEFNPKTMLDFGTGPGTAIWAARELFNVEKFEGVDLSEDMLRVAERLEGKLSMHGENRYTPIDFKRYLAIHPSAPKTDLVISAFTIGDIPSAALQKSTVAQLWDQTGDLLVLVERGTPIGSANIARARQWILDSEREQGGAVHTVAPYPHDLPCPMLYSPDAKPEQMWQHFSQRVQRPPFLMRTKHSKLNTEDATYSYCIMRRGPRPQPTEESSLEMQAYNWPRLIQPPLKRKGHVVMDISAANGEIQRMVIPKSQGKVPYRDARKAMWGDLFPHLSKNKIVTRMSKGVPESESD
ncbi:mitochondrial small ribosomal subunit Rsm22-domain-containing protein [Radiomyces spectabilis]|uniref:mitochondrial small ribosomal subunit Rsm22-domain-containing protein n=1 Tax=Radiomyces spectabilis TaxID=64574 RepID=UPI00221F553B|nr:mitochondrial small ribosomal subunit Rsm22-domain-containing protein [Radiomyces spectabilis]KAI8366658.1 mitochondrial small ribosomal subunit Rsm22-domain-containing protein [Radiomyces spectabilis]